jgi:uncharacterized protein
MFLDLTAIRQPETAIDRTLPVEALPAEDAYRLVVPAVLSGTLLKDEDRFRLQGRVTTRVELECSRCAEPFTMPVDAVIDLRFLPQALAGDKVADPDDDPSTTFYSDDRLDLGQVVREQCYLAIPMKPLCTSECRGLCGHCGLNLNTGQCQCAPQWRDPRLAVLESLTVRADDDA